MAGERVIAPAKLTLSLRITGRRDDGYHLVDAEMVSLDLADELTFSAGDGLEVVEAGSGLPVAVGDDNLVRVALRAAGRTARVRLVKRIPAGAGLGGGSSDAAAVLRWAGVDDPVVAASVGRRRRRSASVAVGPACAASARWSSHCRSRTAPSRC